MKKSRKIIAVIMAAGLFSAQLAMAATATWNYNFNPPPDGGAGSVSPIAQQVLEDSTNVDAGS